VTGFLALIVGCLECQETSRSLGIFPTHALANEACWDWLRANDAPDGDQFASWVLDLSAQTVHQ
jgi:hypothetical protein